ncbi:MAG: hypothetical protein IT498_03000, partial [Rubrivivax sp.]|nr:hypothetical protein [Rubrivivax sp.]
MKILRTAWTSALIGALGLLLALPGHALTAEQAFAMAAAEDTEARVAAINAATL